MLKALLPAALLLLTLSNHAGASTCGDANNDSGLTAGDALTVLRGAVGGAYCETDPMCDVDCDREISASDSLIVLHEAVGLDVGLSCCFADYCHYDEDCEVGEDCGSDEWGDGACVPE